MNAHGLNKIADIEKYGISPRYIGEVIVGHKPITAQVAVILEREWNISAEYWLNMQLAYDLQQARKVLK